MAHIVSVGELLVDMLKKEGDLEFEGSPGGAPCNMLAQAVKLGQECTLITKLGDDYFGHYLKNYVKKIGINTKQIKITNEAHTTLSFVTLDEEGNRNFSFYRKPGADMLIYKKDIDDESINMADIYLYGGVSLSKNPTRNTILSTLEEIKKEKDIITVYDPNLRFPLWESISELKLISLESIKYANILKLSDEELFFLTDKTNIKDGIEYIRNMYNPKLILVSLGKYGCVYNYGKITKRLCTYDTEIIDTTASGDSFLGAVISELLNQKIKLDNIDENIVSKSVDFANAAGALTGTKKGAITALPTREEIEKCIEEIDKLRLNYDYLSN